MDKERIINAINKLIKQDPKFAANLEKLAELSEKKPFIYKQAIEHLNKL